MVASDQTVIVRTPPRPGALRVRRRRRVAGMTLVEVLIALLVTTVGLLGALAMIGTIVRGSVMSRQMTEANLLAQSVIEQSVATNFPAIALGATTQFMDAVGNPVAATAPNAYRVTTTWTQVVALRMCQVDVTWWYPNEDPATQPGHTVSMNREKAP